MQTQKETMLNLLWNWFRRKKSVTPRKLHNPAKELQRPGTKDMQYAYKELPLGNRAFALRMLHLEKKKQKQLEKEFKRMQK
uniref:39S ribosomal protein L52, mitochondrial n=1 Tax=Loa loa TaxID=7209 RepID=A0A1I7VCI1_LOALO